MTDKESPNFLHTPWFSSAPGCDRLQYICTGSYEEKVQNTELGLGIHTGNKSIQLCDGKLQIQRGKSFCKMLPISEPIPGYQELGEDIHKEPFIHADTPQSSQFLPVSDPADAQLEQESKSGQIFLKFPPKSEKRQKCRVDLLLIHMKRELETIQFLADISCLGAIFKPARKRE